MRPRGSRLGQALVELAIAFPVLLLATLVVLQLGLVSVGQAFTQYAAFAAARASLVEPERGRRADPDTAARLALLPVTGASLPGGDASRGAAARWGRELAGLPLGHIASPARLAASRLKTRASVRRSKDRVVATVEHDLELIVPGAGGLVARGALLVRPERSLVHAFYGVPHLKLRGEWILPVGP